MKSVGWLNVRSDRKRPLGGALPSLLIQLSIPVGSRHSQRARIPQSQLMYCDQGCVIKVLRLRYCDEGTVITLPRCHHISCIIQKLIKHVDEFFFTYHTIVIAILTETHTIVPACWYSNTGLNTLMRPTVYIYSRSTLNNACLQKDIEGIRICYG